MADDTLDRSGLPEDLDVHRLRRRALQLAGVLVFVALVVLFAPGIQDLRDDLARASIPWLGIAVVFEVLSCLSYALMFRPVFCPKMPLRTSVRLALSEVGVGSLVPAAGASGLALGAWALNRIGMEPQKIATRSVAFFIIKSSVNFFAVLVIGLLLASGVVGPDLDVWLTLGPAILAVVAIGAVALVPLLLSRTSIGEAPGDAPRWRRLVAGGATALDHGVREAGTLFRRLDPRIAAGSLGYWAFDNAVLWAAFMALSGDTPALGVVLLGYLLGQMGGLLPLPGGLGGVDGGLIGVLVVYGTPLTQATAAVLLYRVVLFWVPLVMGSIAFAGLRKDLDEFEAASAGG